MKYVTIEQWLAKNGTKINYAYVLTKTDDSFDIKLQMMDLQEVVDYYHNRQPGDVFEYRVNEDGLIVSDVNTSKGRYPDRMPVNKTPIHMNPLENSIYHLFNRLMDDNAYLVAPEGLEDLDNIENNIIQFIPKYSISTMSVYIPIPVNFYWKSIKLIYAEGNQIKTNDFYFRVPKAIAHKYNYEFVADVVLAKQAYVIMHYNNENSVYVYDPSTFRLYESMLNKFTYLSKELKNYINVISLVKRQRCKEQMSVEYKHSSKTKSMNIFNSNVSFESTAIDVTRAETVTLMEDIDENLDRLLEIAEDKAEVQQHILGVTTGNIAYSVYFLLIDMYIKTNRYQDAAATFEMCNDALSEYGKQKAKIDAFIYAIRINFFSFSTPMIPNGYTFAGGGAPAKTKFRRVVENDF